MWVRSERGIDSSYKQQPPPSAIIHLSFYVTDRLSWVGRSYETKVTLSVEGVPSPLQLHWRHGKHQEKWHRWYILPVICLVLSSNIPTSSVDSPLLFFKPPTVTVNHYNVCAFLYIRINPINSSRIYLQFDGSQYGMSLFTVTWQKGQEERNYSFSWPLKIHSDKKCCL